MMDYSKMTDEELNEAIVMRKGGVIVYENPYPPMARINGILVPVPDYTHDWRLCGELLEEMRDKCLVSLMNGRLDNPAWVCSIFAAPRGISAISPTPQRAICEAWLAWKEQE